MRKRYDYKQTRETQKKTGMPLTSISSFRPLPLQLERGLRLPVVPQSFPCSPFFTTKWSLLACEQTLSVETKLKCTFLLVRSKQQTTNKETNKEINKHTEGEQTAHPSLPPGGLCSPVSKLLLLIAHEKGFERNKT